MREMAKGNHHFFFVVMGSPNGEPLDLRAWCRRYHSGEHPNFEVTSRGFVRWWSSSFATQVCRYQWYAMPLVPRRIEKNLSRAQVFDLSPRDYEVPTPVERAVANLLFYRKNSSYLDANRMVYLNYEPKPGDHVELVSMIAFPNWGIHIQTHAGGDVILGAENSNCWLASMRKQPSSWVENSEL